MGKRARNGEPIAWLSARVDYAGSECLIWPFARSQTGYGSLSISGKFTTPHRLMCRLAHGEPSSEDLEAAHSCGRGKQGCVNPRHLRWATTKSNHADKIEHGTLLRGQRQWKARLLPAQVLAIYSDTRPDGVIAKEFECSRENVTRIQAGKAWAWLTRHHEMRA